MRRQQSVRAERGTPFSTPLDDHPALPDKMQRDNFVAIVERVADRIGVGRAAARTFARLASLTLPSHWTSGNHSPVVYAEAGEVAKMLGLSQPRCRVITGELERAGLILRRIGANGSRSRYAGTGLFFGPAISRAEELVSLDEAMKAERQHAIYLRGQRSTHRRHLNKALHRLAEIAPTHPDAVAITAKAQVWPSADHLHRMDVGELSEHVDYADSLCRRAIALLEKLEESIGRPLENRRSYIQDTIQESSVICNAGVLDLRAGLPAQDDFLATAPDGAVEGHEKDDVWESGIFNSAFMAKLGPAKLYELAGSDMQFYLSSRAAPDNLRFHDFIWAAERRVPELGISADAWGSALEAMGEDCAMLSVLVIDARKAHSSDAILKPGGYLRGMIDKYRHGKLHLIGSLIGLNERVKNGVGG